MKKEIETSCFWLVRMQLSWSCLALTLSPIALALGALKHYKTLVNSVTTCKCSGVSRGGPTPVFAHTNSKAVNSDPTMTHINDLSDEVLLIIFNHVVERSEDGSSQIDNLHALASTCRRWLDITFIIYHKRLVHAFEDMDDRRRDCWTHYVWLYVVERMARLPETDRVVWESWKCRCAKSLAMGGWSGQGSKIS